MLYSFKAPIASLETFLSTSCIIVYNLVVILISKVLFNSGYRLGLDAIQTLIGDASNKISYGERRTYLLGDQLDSVLGYPFRDNLVNFLNGNDQISLQELLDGIFPKLLPLLLVLGCWQLMAKKNISVVKMILILIIAVFVLAAIGII